MLARKRLAVTAAGVLASLVAAGLIATSDSSVERMVERLLAQHVGAPCRFESARFGLLDGLHVEGLVILDPANPLRAPLVRVDDVRLDYRLDPESRGIALTGLVVDGVELHLTRGPDGVFGLDRLVEIPRSTEPGESLPVTVTSGRVVLRDEALLVPGAEFEVTIADAELAPGARGVSVIRVTGTSGTTGPFELRAALEAGGAQELWLRAPRLPLDAPILDQLAGDLGESVRHLSLGGTASVLAEVRVDAEGRVTPKGTIRVNAGSLLMTLPESEGGTRRPQAFPMEGIELQAEYADDVLTVQTLTARVLDGELAASGTLTGLLASGNDDDGNDDASPPPVLDATAELRALPVTRALRDHLPSSAVRVPDAYDITGIADVDAVLKGPLDDLDAVVEARVRDGTMFYRGYLKPDGTRKAGFRYHGSDVNGWVKQDGATLTFDASCRHGDARIRGVGRIERRGPSMALMTIDIHGQDVALDDDLRAAFVKDVDRVYDRWGPSGVAKDVHVRVESDPDIDGTADAYQVVVNLDGRAQFRPTLLPVPLIDVHGTVRVLEPIESGRRVEHVRLENVRVNGGDFTARATGDVYTRGDGEHESIDVHVESSDVSSFLKAGVLGSDRIGDNVKREYRKIAPSGPAVIDLALRSTPTGRSDTARGRLHGVSTPGWPDVPVAVAGLKGKVALVGDLITLHEMTGSFLGSPIEFDADVDTSGEETAVKLDLLAKSLPLGPELREALGHLADPAAPFWDEFRPRSDARGNVLFSIDTANPDDVTASVSALRGHFDPLGLALRADDGTLRYEDRTASLENLRGTLGQAEARVHRFVIPPDDAPISGLLVLRGLHFPEDLEGLLGAETVATFAELCPASLLHAPALGVTYRPGQRRLTLEGDVALRHRQGQRRPRTGLAPRGELRFAPLDLAFDADGGSDEVEVSGELVAREMTLQAGIELADFDGRAALSGRVGGDGELRLDLTKSRFSAFERRITNARAVVRVGPDGTQVRGVHGALAGGRLRGRVLSGSVAGLGENGYAGAFLLEGSVPGDLMDPDSTDSVEGSVNATLKFENATGEPDDLRGSGTVELRDARNLDVPVYNSVFIVASQMPVVGSSAESSSFEKSDLEFTVEGDSLIINDLTIESPTLTLREGRGRVRLSDGRLDVRVKVVQRFGLRGLDLLLDLGQRFAPMAWIKLSGTLAEPEPPELSLLPFLTDWQEDAPPEPSPADGLHPYAPSPW